MEKLWHTVGEIERSIQVPERTIRRYLNIHGHHIKTKKQGRSVMVAHESIKVIRDIRQWYDAGWSSSQVEDALAQSGLPMVLEIDGHDTAMTPQEALQSLQKGVSEAMSAIASEMEYLRQEVAATREENQKLKQDIDERIEARDKLLMETLRTMQQAAQELKDTRKKGGWSLWPFRHK